MLGFICCSFVSFAYIFTLSQNKWKDPKDTKDEIKQVAIEDDKSLFRSSCQTRPLWQRSTCASVFGDLCCPEGSFQRQKERFLEQSGGC